MTTSPRLQVARFDALCQARGWTTNAARGAALGFSEAALSRLRRGEADPSARFIDAALDVFGVPYHYLFTSAPAPAKAEAEVA